MVIRSSHSSFALELDSLFEPEGANVDDDGTVGAVVAGAVVVEGSRNREVVVVTRGVVVVDVVDDVVDVVEAVVCSFTGDELDEGTSTEEAVDRLVH